MEINKSKTVAEIVSENYKSADVFKKFGIDFCCGGGRSLLEVCDKKGLTFAELESQLSRMDVEISDSHNYMEWSLDFLIEHIINKHHTYVSENIPLILQYSEKVARVHGKNHPENIEIHEIFCKIAEDLLAHMQKEEMVLFPFITEMSKSDSDEFPIPPFGTIQNPIRMMVDEHEKVGNFFKNIASLSHEYSPPDGACNTYKVLYAKLREFEEDLHQHIHLENNILFPQARKLEMSINNKEETVTN